MNSLARLLEVMHRLRRECPWDAEQTHQSLLRYLLEETVEVVEAAELGDDDHLCEELGDLLLQVIFHAEIAAERGAFTLDEIATGITDKLIKRHPYVFAGQAAPADLNSSWEERKAAEKGRTSVLDGLPPQLSALARATKIITRCRARNLAVTPAAGPITSQAVGAQLLQLAVQAQANGIDPEQALRAATRELEEQVRARESSPD